MVIWGKEVGSEAEKRKGPKALSALSGSEGWLCFFLLRHFALRTKSSALAFVGVRGFEPPTSSSRTTRANRTALHPEAGQIYTNLL